MIQKLDPKYLLRLLNNECDVKLYKEGLSEEGEPLEAFRLKKQKCRFIEKTKTVTDLEGRKIMLVGKVILCGDISVLPERYFTVQEINNKNVNELDSKKAKLKTEEIRVNKISGGIVTINECSYEIYQAYKPKNPDGSVYMTILELM